MKVSIGIVIAIIVQAFGIIWYVAQLDSTVKSLDTSVATMQESMADTDIAVLETQVINLKEQVEKLADQEQFDPTDILTAIGELEDRIDELATKDAIIENEMRTIMSDHSNFNDILKDLGKSGYGDNREYGCYGD